MVVGGIVAAAKVAAAKLEVEKVAAGMEEEMAEATEVKQEVAQEGGKEAVEMREATAAGAMEVVGKDRQLVRHLRSSMRRALS